jgi:hypothetical protein
MIIQDLEERGLIQPPSFLSTNVHYLTIMGSHSYGTANTADGDSDLDVYGFVIPPKDVVFPHLGGEIHGFGRQKKHFEQYEAEMILAEGDLDLRRHNEHLKSIRRGDVKEEEIRKWASEKEQQLEKLYVESKLPWGPDESKIKKLLLNCLEAHYGDLSKVVVIPDRFEVALKQVKEIIDKWV